MQLHFLHVVQFFTMAEKTTSLLKQRDWLLSRRAEGGARWRDSLRKNAMGLYGCVGQWLQNTVFPLSQYGNIMNGATICPLTATLRSILPSAP